MGMLHRRILYCILLLFAVTRSVESARCNRMIDGTTRARSPAEEKYSFFMTLYNRTDVVYAYMPDTRYTVTVMAESMGMAPRKFTRFLISAEPEKENEMADVGTFDIMDESISKFADHCANAIVETSKVPKEEVSVAWTSPSEGSGCILIRVTILETPDTWYMDDSNLSMNVCQDTKVEADDQGPVYPDCCACEEAKYEVIFEGLWSRNTHPKDFPSKGWLIRFSDVIGASHTVDYRFWTYNGMASVGLKQVAELGSTRRLESELKDQSEHIRTIIKARGISYPNVTGRTFAVFRVDRKHHLMSLVSMIDPSPDWIVGVSGLELCQSSCTWIEHKELNLYPYDAGTDSGITYLSPNSPTDPPEPIRRITSSYPNDSRSPFYDPSGLDMKPLAKLYLNRQRLYEKTCVNPPIEASDTEACRVTPWSPWGDCPVTCGRGERLRQRNFLNETVANMNKCNTVLTERRTCYGEQSQCGNSGKTSDILRTEMCELTDWSDWSKCSASCGQAIKTRTRNFKHSEYRKRCRPALNRPELQQNMECETQPCPGDDGEEVRDPLSEKDMDDGTRNDDNLANYEDDEPEVEVTEEWLQKCPQDRYTAWSTWSPCSSSCGKGMRIRSRFDKKDWDRMEEEEDKSLEECKQQEQVCFAEITSCDFTKEEAEEICSEPMNVGSCDGNTLRVYFDKHDGQCHQFKYTGCKGNRNNFPTKQDCYTVCGNYQKMSSEFKGLQAGSQVAELAEQDSERVDCQVTKWSTWSQCRGCRGFTQKTRKIVVPARGGGKICPRKLTRRKKCRKILPCCKSNSCPTKNSRRRDHVRNQNLNARQNEISVDCILTSWSSWSRCLRTDRDGSQFRKRKVKVQPRGPNGRLCSTVIEFRNCTLDFP